MQPSNTARSVPMIAGIPVESALMALAVAVIIVVMIFHLLTLTIYPIAYQDEGWLANASWTWLTTGRNFDSMHTGTLDQFGYEWMLRYFLGQMPYVISFKLLGLGLFQSRIVSWLFGGVLLFAIVLVGRRSYNLRVGMLAALLLVLSLPFLQASRYREEIMLAAVIMVSYWLALIAFEKEHWWAHFLAGLLLGAGTDVHQDALLFVPALAMIYIVHYGVRFIFKRGTWFTALGGAIGLLYYLSLHYLQSPATYALLSGYFSVPGSEVTPPILHPTTLWQSFRTELGVRYQFKEDIVTFALLAGAGIYLLVRRSYGDRLLITFAAVTLACFTLFSGHKSSIYAIMLFPFFILIIAAAFDGLLGSAQRVRRLIGALLLVVLIGSSVFQIATRVSANRDYSYDQVVNEIREVIPQDARVMAMPLWWIGLADHDFRSSHNLVYYRYFNHYAIAEGFEAIRPDYVIVDRWQRFHLVSPELEWIQFFAVPAREFWAVMDVHGEKVSTFVDPWHGEIEIYRMSWE